MTDHVIVQRHVLPDHKPKKNNYIIKKNLDSIPAVVRNGKAIKRPRKMWRRVSGCAAFERQRRTRLESLTAKLAQKLGACV